MELKRGSPHRHDTAPGQGGLQPKLRGCGGRISELVREQGNKLGDACRFLVRSEGHHTQPSAVRSGERRAVAVVRPSSSVNSED